MPFGEDVLVFKIGGETGARIREQGGKMMAALSISNPDRVSLKCDPDRAVELRERWPQDIEPAYHFNKRHWNSVRLEGSLSDEQVRGQVDESYRAVYASFPKKWQAEHPL